MYPQQGQLPVPYNQPIGGNWINEPYSEQLPVPQMQIFMQRPDLNWVIAVTAAVLVTNLQNNCQGGPVSTFAYNLFSQNRYSNQFFMMIVQDAVEFALGQLNIAGGQDPQRVVTQAVQFYVNYAIAACAVKFPALQSCLTQEQASRINAVLTQWNQLNAGMTHQPAQQPALTATMPGAIPHMQPPGMVNVGSANDLGRLCVSNVGNFATQVGALAYNPALPDTTGRFGGMTDNRPRPDASPRDQSAAQVPSELQALGVVEVSPALAPRPRPDNLALPSPLDVHPTPAGGAVQLPQSTVTKGIPEVNVYPSQEIDDRFVENIVFDNEVPHEEVSKAPVLDKCVFWPKHLAVSLPKTAASARELSPHDLEVIDIVDLPKGEHDWSILELEDGRVAVMVDRFDSGRTWTEDMPHSYPYDPEKYLRYLMRDDSGHCHEVFLLRDEKVDYHDLEFDEVKRMRVRERQLAEKNILADLSQVTSVVPREVPYTVISAADDLQRAENSADAAKKKEETDKYVGGLTIFEAPSSSIEIIEAQERLEQLLRHVSRANASVSQSGFYYRSFVVEGVGPDVHVMASRDPAKFLPKLVLFIEKLQGLNMRAHRYVNDKCTREANRVLLHAVGIETLTITNFQTDLFDLCTSIEEEFSRHTLEAFEKALLTALSAYTLSHSDSVLKIKHNYNLLTMPVDLAHYNIPMLDEVTKRLTTTDHRGLFDLVNLKGKSEHFHNATRYVCGPNGDLYEVVVSAWDAGYLTLTHV